MNTDTNRTTEARSLLMEKVRKAVLYWDRGDPMRDAIDDDDIGQALSLLVGLDEQNVSGDAKPTFAGVENLTAGPRHGLRSSPEPSAERVGDMELGELYRHCESNPMVYSTLRRLVSRGLAPEIPDALSGEPPEKRPPGSGDTAKEMALMALCMLQREFSGYFSPAMTYDVQTAIDLLRLPPTKRDGE